MELESLINHFCVVINWFRSVARHEPFINPVASLFPVADDELEGEEGDERQRPVSRRSSKRQSVYRSVNFTNIFEQLFHTKVFCKAFCAYTLGL